MVSSIRRAAIVAALVIPSLAAAQPVAPVRLTVTADGTQANGPSHIEKITPDGRTVLFVTTATNLVGVGNGGAQLFVRDRDTDRDGIFDEPGAVATTRVSSGPQNQQNGDLIGGSDMTADGRFVLFSTATPIMPGDTNGDFDAYLRDRDPDGNGIFDEPGAFTVTRVSTGTGNSEANGASRGMQVAGNGRYVLFFSNAANLRAGAGNVYQYYRKDLVTGVTTLVSGRPDGTPADDNLTDARLSADGRLAAVAAGFSALAAAGTHWVLRDLEANTFVPIGDGNPPLSRLPTRAGASSSAPLVIENGAPLVSIGFTPDNRTVYLNVQENVAQPDEVRGSVLEYDIASGRITRRFPGVVPFSRTFLEPAFRDGRTLVYPTTVAFGCTDSIRGVERYDRVTGRISPVISGRVESVASDAEGRRLVFSQTGCGTPTPPTVHYFLDTAYGVPVTLPAPLTAGPMNDAGTTIFISSNDGVLLPAGAGDNGVADIYAVDLPSRMDRDADGMDDSWEAAMGLDYTSNAGPDGASGDADSDGTSNFQEFVNGTHPRGTALQFLAEGADNAFFKTRIGLANPGTVAATAVVRFDGDDGTARSRFVHVPAGAKRTVFLDEVSGHAASFSTVIEANAPLVAERTMSWDATEYGAHAERASALPSTSWFLAEGATGSFSLFYLLQNPADTATSATIRYLRPAPLPPIERTYPLPPHSRVTLPVQLQAPELASTDVSASITATQPILVERAMYRTVGGQPFAAGHASAGVTAAATNWFLAEGATGSFFDFFILLANPNTSAAEVEVRYLLVNGDVLSKTYTVAPESRRTIFVDDEVVETYFGPRQALANATLSCAITSTNGVPIVVERSMWFPGSTLTPDFWSEAHNSPGTTTTSTRWVLADGESGGRRNAQTFILIANTSAVQGQVRLTAMPNASTPLDPSIPPSTYTLMVPARSRSTVAVQGLAEYDGQSYGVIVESVDNTLQLVVERAMYWDANGVTWAAGTNLLATPVP